MRQRAWIDRLDERSARGGAAAVVATVAALCGAAPATAQAPAAATVNANGNLITGMLSFSPGNVSVPLGGIVRWRNTDPVAPHTATEDHNLWDLGGDYFGTPLNPSGFGPMNATVERAFEAGTHYYFCRVHPVEMHGTVAVTPRVTVTRRKVRAPRRGRPRRTVTAVTVTARWAVAEPTAGLVFDVQRRRSNGDWQTLRESTREQAVSFRSPRDRRTAWDIRARLRRAVASDAVTDWSPVGRVIA